MSIDDLGRWDGDVFEFHQPITYEIVGGPGITVRCIDFSTFELPDGITRDEVLLAMLDPRAAAHLYAERTTDNTTVVSPDEPNPPHA